MASPEAAAKGAAAFADALAAPGPVWTRKRATSLTVAWAPLVLWTAVGDGDDISAAPLPPALDRALRGLARPLAAFAASAASQPASLAEPGAACATCSVACAALDLLYGLVLRRRLCMAESEARHALAAASLPLQLAPRLLRMLLEHAPEIELVQPAAELELLPGGTWQGQNLLELMVKFVLGQPSTSLRSLFQLVDARAAGALPAAALEAAQRATLSRSARERWLAEAAELGHGVLLCLELLPAALLLLRLMPAASPGTFGAPSHSRHLRLMLLVALAELLSDELAGQVAAVNAGTGHQPQLSKVAVEALCLGVPQLHALVAAIAAEPCRSARNTAKQRAQQGQHGQALLERCGSMLLVWGALGPNLPAMSPPPLATADACRAAAIAAEAFLRLAPLLPHVPLIRPICGPAGNMWPLLGGAGPARGSTSEIVPGQLPAGERFLSLLQRNPAQGLALSSTWLAGWLLCSAVDCHAVLADMTPAARQLAAESSDALWGAALTACRCIWAQPASPFSSGQAAYVPLGSDFAGPGCRMPYFIALLACRAAVLALRCAIGLGFPEARQRLDCLAVCFLDLLRSPALALEASRAVSRPDQLMSLAASVSGATLVDLFQAPGTGPFLLSCGAAEVIAGLVLQQLALEELLLPDTPAHLLHDTIRAAPSLAAQLATNTALLAALPAYVRMLGARAAAGQGT
ncbi:hypothetical protein ABPG75_001350 [Micractinium tetrahymenae]